MNKINLTLLIFSTLLISSCSKNSEKKVQEENYNIVLDAVEGVTKPYNERNEYLLSIYASISKRNRDSNFVKLEKIKLLTKEIAKQTPKSINRLQSEIKKQDSVKIFKIALDYLKKTNTIEPMLPSLYKKINQDILENPTSGIDSIINSAKQIKEAGLAYKRILENYRDKNKLFEE